METTLLFIVIVSAILVAMTLWHYPTQVLKFVALGILFVAIMITSREQGYNGLAVALLAFLGIAILKPILRVVNRWSNRQPLW